MNVLLLSIGAKHALVTFFTNKDSGFDKVVTTDCSPYSAGLFASTSHYIVPRMKDPDYIPSLVKICKDEQIDVIIPSQEDELILISDNIQAFKDINVLIVTSEADILKLCRDKLDLYKFLSEKGIPCVETMDCNNLDYDKVDFPVYLKPRHGAGSIGNIKISSPELLKAYLCESNEAMILQPYKKATEYGVDVYVDLVSGEITDIFVKEKIRMRAGETEKSLSVKCPEIEQIVKDIIKALSLRGPIDMDFFFCDNKFMLLEINPRFGGGYPHAFACGINFPKNIANNAKNIANEINIGNYPENVVALKYTDTLIMEK